ncbi:MAG TPA: hypothetical protein VHO48_03850 [Anaerolineaceae bacterium]|nr:hypothetical protein [Anaerolineaceae bacterium]
MNTDKMQFLPFNAINEFMRPDFRQEVIHRVLTGFNSLSDGQRNHLGKLLRQAVSVPGFRNSLQAPLSVRMRPTISAFESRAPVTAAIISAWAELHADLREKIHTLLTSRGWEILPGDADRTQLPGFFTAWPANENFDNLQKAFVEAYPDGNENLDDISLMAVWVGLRLPYNTEGEDNNEAEAS